MPDEDQFQKPRKNLTQTRPMRQFPPVGDPDDTEAAQSIPSEFSHFEVSPDEEEALRKARKEKLNPPISPQSKTRLEYLTDIGKMTKEVSVGGTIFTLRTLKAKEQRQVYLTLVDISNKVDEAYNLKFHTLAHSLIKIDGQDVQVMVKVNSYSDKLKMLEDMEEVLTDQLFSAYQELKTTSDAQFAIKTERDIREVQEDLKKS